MGAAIATLVGRSLLCAIIFDALVPLSPFIAEDMHATPADFQATLALGLIGFSLSHWLAPRCIDWLGLRRSLFATSTLVALIAMLIAVTTNWLLLSALLLCMFVLNAIASTATRASLHERLDPHAFEQLTAYLYALTCGLGILTPIILVSIADAASWRWAWTGLAFALLIASTAILGIKTNHTGLPTPPRPASTAKTLWLKPGFVLVLLIGVMSQASFTSLTLAKAFILKDSFGLSTQTMGWVIGALAACNVLGFFCSGKAVSWLGEYPRLATGLLCQALAAALLMMAGDSGELYLFLAAAVLTGLAHCFLLPLASTWALAAEPALRVQAAAWFGGVTTSVAALIVLSGTLSKSALLTKLGWICCACLLANILLASRVRRDWPQGYLRG